jgi:tetratricopeptide (TPR) repeat protein
MNAFAFRSSIAAALLLFGVGCAIPRNHSSFDVRAGGQADAAVFLSSNELLAAGLVSESITYGSKGRLFDAEARLRKALAVDPENERILFNLAVVIGQAGQYEEAIAILDSLRRTQGDKPNLLLALADIRNTQGDRRQARSLLKDAFGIYANVGNTAQAALVARSISNLAFAEGLEQEALCYSFEALTLAPNSGQLGAHASLLNGINAFLAVDTTLSTRIAKAPALGASVAVHYAWSLAKFGLGDYTGALKEIEKAQDFAAENPELAGEVNVVWWLLKRREGAASSIDDSTADRLESMYPDVTRLRDKPSYSLLRWPVALRQMLEAAT